MNQLVAPPTEPVSQELAVAVVAAMNPHPDVPDAIPALSDRARAEIAGRIRALNAELQPATPDQWKAFLQPMVFAVGNPPSREEFAAKLGAIAFGLSHIPGSVLTRERSAEALRRHKFWPTVCELGDWLSPIAAGLREERRALERLAMAPALPAPTAQQRTEAERAHVTAVARAFAADMAALNKPKASVVARSRPVGDQDLLIAYERAAATPGPGQGALKARLETLRAKLGIESEDV